MLRHFEQIVNETVDQAFDGGIAMFMENLESDLAKDALLESQGGVEGYLKAILENADADDDFSDEELESISEEDVDALLAELEAEE